MTARIDRECSNIGLDNVMVNLDPAISVVSRAENAAGAADEIGSDEDVPANILDRQRCLVLCKQTVVNLLPTLAVIVRSKHAYPVRSGKNDIARVDVWAANSWNGY